MRRPSEPAPSTRKNGYHPKEGICDGVGPVLTGGTQQTRGEQRLGSNTEGTVAPQKICMIVKICVGFDDHKKEIFNLVQALRVLFLYTQADRDRMDEYTQNFKSLWDRVEAFRGSLGIHKGLVNRLLATPGRVRDADSITKDERPPQKKK
jgi:hypothetical protein